jgi:hypothetical protein
MANKHAVKASEMIYMLAFIILSTFALFTLDKDTHGIADLFTPSNLAALVLYVVPTFIICSLFLFLIKNRKRPSGSLLLSLALGIPVGYALVIIVMILIRQ